VTTAVPPDPEHPSTVDLGLFREVLACFPAGVVIVTALGEEGRPRGLTVNAFCSVSAVPPLVLVCVDAGSNTLPAIRYSGAFTVNILAAGRQELAMRFASKTADKFAGVQWTEPPVGIGGPVLGTDAAAHLVCRVDREVEAGDHWVFIGMAVEAGVQREHPPLLYHRRGFAEVGGLGGRA
jgi:flavin reductase (DIM6/NTAB) family NADH-FMN oxidoreductase RutF